MRTSDVIFNSTSIDTEFNLENKSGEAVSLPGVF